MNSDYCIGYAKKQVFVCCPFDMMIKGLIDKLLEHKINPEIGLNCNMAQYSEVDINRVATRLKEAGCNSMVHAPFSDLVMGASDKAIRQVSVDRIKYAVNVAKIVKAKHVVFHSGYDAWHHGEHRTRFLENAIGSILEITDYASSLGIRMMLENVYEPTPWLHEEIFSRTEQLGFCFDAGHAIVFSKTGPEEWLHAVGERLGHIHLHDNMGSHDDHLPPGKGIIDFDNIFRWIEQHRLGPAITVEPHKEAFVYPALEAAGRLMLEYGL